MTQMKEAPGSNAVFCVLAGLAAGVIVYLLIAILGTGWFSNAAFFGGGAAGAIVAALVLYLFVDAPAPLGSVTAPSAAAPSAPAPSAPAKAAAPAAAPAPAAEAAAGSAPAMLSAAREGGADDLKKISGVGPKLEGELNAKGVYHLDQIASWTPEQVAWADENLVKFKGRVSRDDWVGQAKALLNG